MSLWSRLFGGKSPSKARDMRDNSDNWRVGDMALCVDGRWATQGPRTGSVHRVTMVAEGISTHGIPGVLVIALSFTEFGTVGFWTGAFRRQRPNESEAREQWTQMLTNPVKIEA